MTRKNLILSLLSLLVFIVLVALFWRDQFAHTPPSLRSLVGDQIEGDMQIYGESPRQDALAQRALLADAQRGNPAAQFMQGMMLEPVDIKEAMRWYEAAAAQGDEGAIARLQALRAQPSAR
ncbi:sel1 repeat family protein [Achromobacter sp. PAB15]|jgi:hypothetical protein|uniref:sel1 repeat family protein n=1 Tax=Achromobacter sp. PAB15 TaxID=3233048 RepID=UPI003F937E85